MSEWLRCWVEDPRVVGSSPGPATFFSARRRDPDARRPKEQPQCALPHRGQRGSRTGARRARDLGSPSPSPSVEPAPSPPLEHNAVRRSGNGEAPTGRNRTGRHPTAGEGALRHQSFLMGGLLQTPGGRSNAPWGLPQRLEPGSSPPVGGSPRRQSHLARARAVGVRLTGFEGGRLRKRKTGRTEAKHDR